jgi:hypothetical protein
MQPITHVEDGAVIIPLGGKRPGEAYVDPEDAWVLRYWWTRWVSPRANVEYAISTINGKNARLHLLLLNPEKGWQVDHLDFDGLNCRRSNMRLVRHHDNIVHQRPTRGGSSQYKGVSWEKKRGCWVAHIMIDRHGICIGSFWDEEDAAIAYDNWAFRAWGEFAYLNFPGEKKM